MPDLLLGDPDTPRKTGKPSTPNLLPSEGQSLAASSKSYFGGSQYLCSDWDLRKHTANSQPEPFLVNRMSYQAGEQDQKYNNGLNQ